jgi:hypothetical protein
LPTSSPVTTYSPTSIQLGAIGLSIELTIYANTTNLPKDVSGATVKRLRFKKPGGVSFEKDATFTTDGTDGKINYVTQSSSDIDRQGTWNVQAYLVLSDFTGYTSISTFTVGTNL